MNNQIITVASKLALKFADDPDIPSRLRKKSKQKELKQNKIEQEETAELSKVEQRFQEKLSNWELLIKRMLEKIDNEKAWRFLLIKPVVEEGIKSATESKDFTDFLDYLILRRDKENCEPIELGYLCMLHTEFQREIERKIENTTNRLAHANTKIDLIAIDFETANEQRLSACAIGLAFVKDNEIIDRKHFYIKPPADHSFFANTYIHGIDSKDVKDADSFDIIWQNELSNYFNDHLIIFHNSSMDLSILKNVFERYKIIDYDLKYIDTMQLADTVGMPRKLRELTAHLGVEFNNVHDPVEDAEVCAKAFVEITKQYPNYHPYVKYLSASVKPKPKSRHLRVSKAVKDENFDILNQYAITQEELEVLTIEGNAFLFTGDINIDREEAHDFILENGGVIKKGISSKVNYVVVGTDYGWSKIQKLKEYNDNKGCDIKILSVEDFNTLIGA